MDASTQTGQPDPYADASETTSGRVYTVTGQNWDSLVQGIGEHADERVVVNMGPQHPSTHGVLRLILELEGETVTEARCGIHIAESRAHAFDKALDKARDIRVFPEYDLNCGAVGRVLWE